MRYAREVLRRRATGPGSTNCSKPCATSDRVSGAVGHKVSKSTSAACLAWWWCGDPVARPDARCILTSSGNRQVKSILWREIKRMHRTARTSLGPRPADALDTGVQWRTAARFSDSPRRSPNAWRASGARTCCSSDEVSGIPPEISRRSRVTSRRRQDPAVVEPTQTRRVYDSHTRASGSSPTLYISPEETRNKYVASGPRRARVARMGRRGAARGEDSPLYQVRVRVTSCACQRHRRPCPGRRGRAVKHRRG